MPPPHREWLRQLVGALQEGCAALERVLDDWPESDAEEGRSEVRRDAQHVISLFDYTTLALQPWKRHKAAKKMKIEVDCNTSNKLKYTLESLKNTFKN